MYKRINFQFYLQQPVEISVVPTRKNIVNKFDYHGDIVSLKRLDGETNVEFRNRIWDTTVNQGGPDYLGVINNITRELGLLKKPAIRIDLKTTSAGDILADNPRVDILANRVVLYSDWRPDGTSIIDREIRTYQLGDDGYYLDDLATCINESSFFSATLIEDIRPNTISSTLVRGTSDLFIQEDYIHADKYINLAFSYIIQNSIVFNETDIFSTEVDGYPNEDGEYLIDYQNGIIVSYNTPSGNGSCSYHAAKFPFDVYSSPVQLFSLQDDNFQDELFVKETLDSSEEQNGLLNAEGTDIYQTLFLDTEFFWGE